jgi:hypothetical protein
MDFEILLFFNNLLARLLSLPGLTTALFPFSLSESGC